jgi:hypothetical protein
MPRPRARQVRSLNLSGKFWGGSLRRMVAGRSYVERRRGRMKAASSGKELAA